MMARSIIGYVGAISLLLTGCNVRLPGKPNESERWRAPAEISDFNQLYTQNCAGCHGVGGKLGAARSLNDPVYLAFVNEEALSQAIADGRAGTSMPAFSEQAGGHLTDQQIETIAAGIRAQWSRPDDFKGVEIPRYSVEQTADTNSSTGAASDAISSKTFPSGDVSRGAAAYKTYCSSCHGTDGDGGSAGSIVDLNFLNLVSDQGLRTTIVVGRADMGKPDWRGNVPGHPMSAQEIDDVVAWLTARRQRTKATLSKVDHSASLNVK
jgi:cytochrome c oxidase cbb3-type subunit 3/ubiquinol-cytochrome c reductase cytochrome c subunit